jgi:hypothetical protein
VDQDGQGFHYLFHNITHSTPTKDEIQMI